MYSKHFGLMERPFSLSPDPDYLFTSRKHGMALTMLEYGITSESPFILITGEIGAGKTTILRYLLNQLDGRSVVGLISHTHANLGSLREWVALAFGLDLANKEGSRSFSEFQAFLIDQYSKGMRCVLVIDEGQNLTIDQLEELRLLSNINADKSVLLQTVIAGQPELRAHLREPKLQQFAQRITVDFHLEALDLRETREYIQFRIMKAGGNKLLFTPDAIMSVFKASRGIPRTINALCDLALVYAFAGGRTKVNGRLVNEVIEERRSKGLFGAGIVFADS